jgi:6-phosphogluconolactonase
LASDPPGDAAITQPTMSIKTRNTEYGRLCIGPQEELFAHGIELVDRHRQERDLTELTWALTGGSTPAAFYRYCAEGKRLPADLVKATCWFTSDERMVHLDSDQSNFGNAGRLLLDHYGITDDKRFPWPVDHEPADAAALFNDLWHSNFSDFRCFDICFLGMGEDCHTASIFPRSPLIGERGKKFFAYVEVPNIGPRLTITPYGLGHCGLIVVMVAGKNKAFPLHQVFDTLHEPREHPAQMLMDHAARVVWLVDDEAGARLDG